MVQWFGSPFTLGIKGVRRLRDGTLSESDSGSVYCPENIFILQYKQDGEPKQSPADAMTWENAADGPWKPRQIEFTRQTPEEERAAHGKIPEACEVFLLSVQIILINISM